MEKGKFIEGLLSSKGIILKTAKLTIKNDELPEKYWFVLELMTLNHEHNKSYSKSVNKTPFVFSPNFISVFPPATMASGRALLTNGSPVPQM